jgi:3D (Asp-Asp-Asp) domain-containing protein
VLAATSRALPLVMLLAVLAAGCAPTSGRAPSSLTAHVTSPSAGGKAAGLPDCFDLGRMDDPDRLFGAACPPRRSLTVKAKAYVAHGRKKKTGYPRGAWGDTLTPDIKAIAVSPDLVDAGLGYKAKLTIEGLPGEYQVLDLMHGRWRKTIDVYFGDDRQAARQWGNRTITISFD